MHLFSTLILCTLFWFCPTHAGLGGHRAGASCCSWGPPRAAPRHRAQHAHQSRVLTPPNLLPCNYTTSFQAQSELPAGTSVQLKALSDTSMEVTVSRAKFSVNIPKAALNSPGEAQRRTKKTTQTQPPSTALFAHMNRLQTRGAVQQLALCNCTWCVTLASHLKSKEVTEVNTNTIRIFLGCVFIAAQMNSRIFI